MVEGVLGGIGGWDGSRTGLLVQVWGRMGKVVGNRGIVVLRMIIGVRGVSVIQGMASIERM